MHAQRVHAAEKTEHESEQTLGVESFPHPTQCVTAAAGAPSTRPHHQLGHALYARVAIERAQHRGPCRPSAASGDGRRLHSRARREVPAAPRRREKFCDMLLGVSGVVLRAEM